MHFLSGAFLILASLSPPGSIVFTEPEPLGWAEVMYSEDVTEEQAYQTAFQIATQTVFLTNLCMFFQGLRNGDDGVDLYVRYQTIPTTDGRTKMVLFVYHDECKVPK